jgi:hypothetical protein
VAEGLSVAAASSADVALHTVRQAASMAALAVDFTAARREDSTVVAAAMAVEAADTGNRGLVRSLLIQ